jgi:tRNA nucleotidyltransferase (CCA-adding enzyme)
MATLVPPLASLSAEEVAALDCLPPPTLPGRPQRRTTRLAALFLPLDAKTVDATLRALRFSGADSSWITALAERWRALGGELTGALAAGDVSDATLRRWAAASGRTRLAPLLRLAAATWAARRAAGHPAPDARRVRSTYRRAVRVAYRDPIEIGDLAVDGDDLRGAGIPPGPDLGMILHALLDVVLADPAANTRERLLAESARIHERLRADTARRRRGDTDSPG